MSFKKVKTIIKYLLIVTILAIIVGGGIWRINNFLVEKRFAKSLEGRVLLIVIENNFNLPPETEENYQKYKNLVDTIFSHILKVNKEDLKDKNLPEIVDIYLEDYLAKRFKNAAKNYGKIVILSDERASYDNFKRVLIDLNNEGRIVDILLDLHGGAYNVSFYNQTISKYSIASDKNFGLDQRLLNLGYVYQTVCYGGENMEVWLKLNAKVVSGSKGLNSFVILAPERFLYLWTHGKTYYGAVNGGFNFEVLVWKIIGRFLPNTIFSVKEDDLESSKMIFIGEKDYKLE